MAVTNYYSIGGEVIAERTAGSARVDYLTDALGSITATVNQSAQVVNTYRYKPAGSQLAKTGIGADPAFGWAGYLPTQKRFSEHYLRGRHVSDLIGVFTAKDQFISAVSPYAYALNNPVLFTDPMGWAPCQGQAPPPQPKLAPVTPAPAPAPPQNPGPVVDCNKPRPTDPNLPQLSLAWCKQCYRPNCDTQYVTAPCAHNITDCGCCGTEGGYFYLCDGAVRVDCKKGLRPPTAPGSPGSGNARCTAGEIGLCFGTDGRAMLKCLGQGHNIVTCCDRTCGKDKGTQTPKTPPVTPPATTQPAAGSTPAF